MPHRILIAADVDPLLVELLSADGRFEVDYAPCTREEEIAERIGGATVLVTRHHNRIGPRVFSAAGHLELIVQGTSGLDNIDGDAAKAAGVRIAGVPGENANAVAELVIGHMIALTRTVPTYAAMVKSGAWMREDCATRRELAGYRLGLVGIGRVGTRVSRLAAAFGMRVEAYDPYLTNEEIATRGATRAATLEELLRASEILSLHVPLTPETRGMIDRAAIDLLPRGAFVINTSRGPVVDQRSLFEALAGNRLGGIALDVFDPEPPEAAPLPDDPRLIVTPHVAGCSKEAKASIARAVYLKLCESLGVEPLAHRVSEEP